MAVHSQKEAMIPVLRFIYRRLISPAIHFLAGPSFGCRYHPTCSEYFFQAVENRGWIQGSYFGFKRLFSCHPWGGQGYDPPPTKIKG